MTRPLYHLIHTWIAKTYCWKEERHQQRVNEESMREEEEGGGGVGFTVLSYKE
jgi:hypothetical protein